MVIEYLLAALAAVLSCFLLAREVYRLRRVGTLGPLLWHSPGRHPLAAYMWLGVGGLRVSDFLYTWHKTGLTEYRSLSLGVLFLLLARANFLDRRGLAVHEAGIDAGSVIFGWNELRKWSWDDDRQAIRFWSTSLVFFGPHRIRQNFNPELDALLYSRVPAEAVTNAS